MTDPAIETAQRLLKCRPQALPGTHHLCASTAREALKPIRELVDKYESDPIGGWSLGDFLNDLGPLIYTAEELERMSAAGIQAYVQLPPCTGPSGHDFTIPPAQTRAVCRRCGLIRLPQEVER